MDKICELCGEEFKTYTRSRRFCCRSCSEQWQKQNLANDPTGENKRCKKCGTMQQVEAFRSKGNRRQPYCKPCMDIYQSERWIRKKVMAINYLGGKCVDCGFRGHPAAFDFHHEDGAIKEAEWSVLRRRSWNKIQKELDKCTLVCSNCHRIRHSQSKAWRIVPVAQLDSAKPS